MERDSFFMRRGTLVVATLIMLAAGIATAQVPETMSFQGELGSAIGANSTQSLTFRIYDASSGGTELWSETQSVTLRNRVFSVILGSSTPLEIPFDEQYWIGVSVGTGSEMTPRVQLTSAPYALNARHAETASVLLNAPTSLPPSGPAGGDLGGSYPDPSVVRMQGRAVAATAPANGDLLKWNAGSSQWEPSAAAGGNDWSLTGNAGTAPGTNFIGTTDNADLVVKSNGSERMRIASDGRITVTGAEIEPLFDNEEPVSQGPSHIEWFPAKGAFRAGFTDADQWGNASIGFSSTALGHATTASGLASTALGFYSHATAELSMAMGSSTASGHNSTAMGGLTVAGGFYSTSGGVYSTANGQASIAMGYSTTASGMNAVALGEFTIASGYSSTALGGSGRNGYDGVSPDEITYDAPVASGDFSLATGEGTVASGFGSTAMGVNAAASGSYSLASGNSANATSPNTVALGFQSTASGEESVAIGYQSTASGQRSIAMGSIANASGLIATSIGESTTANGRGSTAMGFYTTAAGDRSTALGSKVTTGDYSFGYAGFLDDDHATDISSMSNVAYFGDVDLMIGNVNDNARSLRFYEPNSSLTLAGASYTAFKAQAQSADITYTLPSSQGTAGTVLTNDGSGMLSWSASGIGGSGTTSRLAFWNSSSSLASTSDVTYDNANSRVGLGTTTPARKLEIAGGDILLGNGKGIYFRNASGVDEASGLFYTEYYQDINLLNANPNGRIIMGANDIRAMAITENGTVVVGGVAQNGGVGTLHVRDNRSGSSTRVMIEDGMSQGDDELLGLYPRGGGDPYLAVRSGMVAFNATTPATTADINGDLAIRAGSVSLGAGANNDVVVGSRSYVRIGNPGGNATLTGVAGGQDGKVLIIYYNDEGSGSTLTVAHENTGSSAANRITAMDGSDAVLSGKGSVTLIYDAADDRWIVVEARQ